MIETWELGTVADDRGRDARVDARGNDLVRGVRCRPRVKRGVHLVGAHEASEHRAELLVVGHVGATDETRE